MLISFLKSLSLIFISELGDKTQVLAMIFATRYRTSQVLLGVSIGCMLNHGLAVALGSFLSNFISNEFLQIIGGMIFILFGLWSLNLDDEEDDDFKEMSPILTVALAFFIGELGDKTQLTAITLGATLKYPLFILLGTVSGMVLTSGMGIFVGSIIGNKISGIQIKFCSAFVFILIGITKLYFNIPITYKNPYILTIFFVSLLGLIYMKVKPILNNNSKVQFDEVAATLYDQAHFIKEYAQEVCINHKSCDKCRELSCILGYIQRVIEDEIHDTHLDFSLSEPEYLKESIDEKFLIRLLALILSYSYDKGSISNDLDKARNILEFHLFKESFNLPDEINSYIIMAKSKNMEIACKLEKEVKNPS
ncbi:TMEM165/GDT1 family protein [Anaeromicrobium sediminis]|uniref:GDT1 family protein n=1 Tax=Anaeromicrobium sediminis TaxID=1478221 RepID=A0A267MIG7_9FIRM|nr:TMEM165/GDT1 family protein [Anaeromicrobium sediminis]PAB58728.1 hypothetical protein CCE28_13745 [Anaeromicrobium sediminis]